MVVSKICAKIRNRSLKKQEKNDKVVETTIYFHAQQLKLDQDICFILYPASSDLILSFNAY